MSRKVPPPNPSTPPATGTAVPAGDASLAATVQVAVARVPVSQLVNEPARPTVSSAAPPPASDTAALPDDAAVLKQMIAELLRELRRERRDRQEIQQRLDALLRRWYGPRTERPNPDQPLLFPESDMPLSPAPPAPPPDEPPPSPRRQSKPHGRRRPAPNLRHEPRRYELTPAERLCPECGSTRAEIGVESTTQYDYQPAEVFVVEHQRVKYACRCCAGQVVTAPKPPQPLAKGLPGPGLLAHVAVDKYLDHLPLHRTAQRLERLGVPLSRSTLCDWMAAIAERLTPLWRTLKDWVLASKVLHTDDTTVAVRDETRSSHRYGRLWPYIGDAAHPGIVFDYTTTHARDGPAAFLKDFKGFLQADAYGVYDGIYTGSNGSIVEVGCWAHARGKFADAQATAPEQALAAKAWIRKLYDVEDDAKRLSAAERLRLRQERSVPLLATFHQWLLVQKALVLPKSPVAAAVTYTLNQWQALNRYTTDGDLHIDNNVAERTLKLIGQGRDNWLFLGSDNGGRTAAVLYSFTATCKQQGIDSFAYLRAVLEQLPTQPAKRLEELLPHRWQARRSAEAPSPTNAPSSVATPSLS
jgi:transposase